MRFVIAATALVGVAAATMAPSTYEDEKDDSGGYDYDSFGFDAPVQAKTSTVRKVVTITSCAPGVKNCPGHQTMSATATASATATGVPTRSATRSATTQASKTGSAAVTATGKPKGHDDYDYDPYDPFGPYGPETGYPKATSKSASQTAKATSKPSAQSTAASPFHTAACGTMQVIEVPVVYTTYSRSTVNAPCPTTTSPPKSPTYPRPAPNSTATHTRATVTPTVVPAGAAVAKVGSTLAVALAAMVLLF